MNEIIPFAFGDNLVRVIRDEDGNPWLVAKDVAVALDYVWNGASRIAHVPEEWRGVTSVVTPFGLQEMLTISEQGLYFFLARSDKPGALPFQKWLAGEVLPSIRKAGRYIHPWRTAETPEPMALDFESLPEDVRRLKARVRERCMHLALQSARLAGLGSPAEQLALFIEFCRMLGGPSWNPDGPPHDERGRLLEEYIRACLVSAPGNRLPSEALYRHFEKWWAENCPGSPVPWKSALGKAVKRFYRPFKSYRWYYLDVAIAPEN